ncbi:MAG: tRNA threonylcarbamoyladenosine dehydratase [Spirochaetaceae bacterium]|nr:tRNA threonylcarbamoyladenosine dehydratase [Spirochaetaceae bacterium]
MSAQINGSFQRLALLTGEAALAALGGSRAIVVGLGGVGGWCAEALVRSGLGALTIVDSDTVCVTNINRQVQAARNTIGLYKADVLRSRLLEINPDCRITAVNKAFDAENAASFRLESYDYVIDAIDSLSCKIALIEAGAALGRPLFSSMGMAQKLDPARIKTADIWKTHGCPLARLVRRELRKRAFEGHFTAVYSDERLPLRKEVHAACGNALCLCPRGKPDGAREWCSSKKVINGSAMPVTASAGMILASLVIQDCVKQQGQ